MIIRSQNKNVICNFGTGNVIFVNKAIDGVFEIRVGINNNECVVGGFTTENEAARAIGSIYAALKAGTEFYDMPDAPEKDEDYEHPEDIKLDKLQEWGELSNRTANALRRAGYTTLKEAAEVDVEKLRKIRNIGSSSVCELRRVYEKFQEGKI